MLVALNRLVFASVTCVHIFLNARLTNNLIKNERRPSSGIGIEDWNEKHVELLANPGGGKSLAEQAKYLMTSD